MCNYRENDKCKITNERCPWAQWCGKLQTYKERAGMEQYCKYLKNQDIPNGYNKVAFERHGYLYVEIDNRTIKIANPYDYIPQFVKLSNTKSGWKIKKEKNEN